MATYPELYQLATGEVDHDLRSRLAVAASIKAELISQEVTPSQARGDWSREALANPQDKVPLLLNYLLAIENASTVVNITGVSDASMQTRVNSAIDALFP